jgi:type IV secretion system protein VirB10
MKPESEIPEEQREPQYRRKAQVFLMAVVGLLAAVLIIDVFQRMGRNDKAQPESPAAERIEAARGATDADEFDRQFQDEVRRRRSRQPEAAAKETPEQILKRLRDQKDKAIKGEADGPQAGPKLKDSRNPEEDWQIQERLRALQSRKAHYGKSRVMDSPGPDDTPPPVKPVLAAAPGGPIDEQEAEIRRRLKALEGVKRELAGKPGRAVMIRRPAPPAIAAADEPSTLGQPLAEARPKPGQKLIPTGTVISAVLDQNVVSDYAGSAYRFMIGHDVYDIDRKEILIPKGSRGVGKTLRITNVNEPIQARMGLTVNWIVLPDGKRISFEKHGVLDREGIGAVADQVDYHFLAQFLGVAAYALLSHETSREGSGTANDNTFEGDLGQSARKQYAPLAQKYLSIVPTITLRPGTPLKIFLEDDVYAYPWKSLEAGFLPSG